MITHCTSWLSVFISFSRALAKLVTSWFYIAMRKIVCKTHFVATCTCWILYMHTRIWKPGGVIFDFSSCMRIGVKSEKSKYWRMPDERSKWPHPSDFLKHTVKDMYTGKRVTWAFINQLFWFKNVCIHVLRIFFLIHNSLLNNVMCYVYNNLR